MSTAVLSFSSPVVTRLVDITPRQLLHWTASKIVIPSIDEGRGQGNRKKWAFTDIVGLRVIRELLCLGVPLQRVRKILPQLRAFTGQQHNLRALAESRLVVLGDGEVAVSFDDETLVALLHKPGQTIAASIVIELRLAVVDIQRQMLIRGMAVEIAELKQAGAWVADVA